MRMDYSEFYNENSGKNVRAEMTDGEVISGKLYGYISEKDNEPDPESIIVKNSDGMLTELFTDEIAGIALGN